MAIKKRMFSQGLQQCLGAVLLLGYALCAQAAPLTVSAAASLTEAFKAVAARYQALHPDAPIALNFAASGLLLQQLRQGAPVDVLAFADEETMDSAAQQGLVVPSSRQDFVGNTLVVIAPADSHLQVHDLAELAALKPAVRVARGQPSSVPAGRYAQKALEAAHVAQAMQSQMIDTLNVRQSLDYVARGEVDAGFVYASDAKLMQDKVKVLFAPTLPMAIRYPIATAQASLQKQEAARFIAFVRAPEGQEILSRYGFAKWK